jgi:hypothetical protein
VVSSSAAGQVRERARANRLTIVEQNAVDFGQFLVRVS